MADYILNMIGHNPLLSTVCLWRVRETTYRQKSVASHRLGRSWPMLSPLVQTTASECEPFSPGVCRDERMTVCARAGLTKPLIGWSEMSEDRDAKSIDFDQVADLYDSYVQVDFDLEFWKQEAAANHGKVLELMCGTGRIGLPLIDAHVSYTGLDYCRGQIDQFQSKLTSGGHRAHLVFCDARTFDLRESFSLVFIGFSSLSEVLDNRDKIKVLQRVRAHVDPRGHFTFSLHNPAVRNLSLDQSHVFDLHDGERTLAFSARFEPPSSAGIVTGTQRYVIKSRDGTTLEERELGLRFHLIPKDEIESLLARTGFQVEEMWGDYDRAPFNETSPFMIYRCRANLGSS